MVAAEGKIPPAARENPRPASKIHAPREAQPMSEVREKLPVLPLSAGVVLPHMNVTIQLDSPEAQAAVNTANLASRQVVLLPKVGGRYASVGTVAKLEDTGNLPTGEEIVVVQGRHRAVMGKVEAEIDGTLLGDFTPVFDPAAPSEKARD